MPAPARTAAYRALRAIGDQRLDLPAALAVSRRDLTDDRDRGLAAEIITGTLRWQRSLDHLVEQFAGRPLAKIDRDILHILRLSLYQLLHLDRVPASAAVDEAVDLARYAKKPRATGFVNAVLRTAARSRRRLPLPARPESAADRQAALDYLGVTHSHPDWLVARWMDRHGFDAAERWVRFNNETPRLTLSVNTLRMSRDTVAAALDREDIETEPTRRAPHGLIVNLGNPLRAPLDGSFVVQDEASQLVSLTVAPRPGDRVLDLCASPGGKTLGMAARMGDTGVMVACDVRARRLSLLRDTIRLSGAGRIRIVHVPIDGALPFRPLFDRVLVDAPCSGLGTIRRDPDIRWRRDERDLRVLAESQLRLLRRAADVVRPGGRLVYATCSSEPEENEDVVDAFLSQRRDYTVADLRADGDQALEPLIDERGMMRTLPFEHGLEAFFAAAMVRR